MRPKTLLIGARGVGKTTLLRRWQQQSTLNRQWIDLDEAIEKKHRRKIADIFSQQGEQSFRFEEHMMLTELLKDKSESAIAIGAGFQWEGWNWPIPREQIEIIWIARESDEAGRIFLDRPRLEAEISELEEFLKRYTERTKNYRAQADWVHLMPEGEFARSAEELAILESPACGLGGIFTIHPRHQSAVFFEKLKAWQFDFIEVRDDLWSFGQLGELKRKLSAAGQNILWSRRSGKIDLAPLMSKNDMLDCAIEVSPNPPPGCSIISSHGKEPPTGRMHLKWSPLVESWTDLIEGIQWQGENPVGRSYLPRSKTGRWRWLRLWQKGRQQLNFVRDSVGEIADQPTLHEWMRSVAKPSAFGAVLGSPVTFSWSPMEHLEFFRKRGMPFYSVSIQRDELSQAMGLLEGLGLRAAAITSPLKEESFQWTQNFSEIAKKLQSANTLILKDSQWFATNTDVTGLLAVKQQHQLGDEAWVWGGGGTVTSIQSIFPQAQFFSIRTGKPKSAHQIAKASSSLGSFVIWAAGPDASLPPPEWKPKVIFDLNYLEASRAREYALAHQAKYISGREMFHAQAKAQQDLWEKTL